MASPLVTVAIMTEAPPSLVSSAADLCPDCRCNAAPLPGERLFCPSARDRHRLETHFRCVLHAEMTRSLILRTPTTSLGRAAVAERVEGCQAGAQEPGALDRREVVGDERESFRGRDHVFSIAAVEQMPVTSNSTSQAKIAAPARVAMAAI